MTIILSGLPFLYLLYLRRSIQLFSGCVLGSYANANEPLPIGDYNISDPLIFAILLISRFYDKTRTRENNGIANIKGFIRQYGGQKDKPSVHHVKFKAMLRNIHMILFINNFRVGMSIFLHFTYYSIQHETSYIYIYDKQTYENDVDKYFLNICYDAFF